MTHGRIWGGGGLGSPIDVLSHADALIYILLAKSLVVVVVSSIDVVKPLSRLVVVQSEVLHLLECQLGLMPSDQCN